MEEKQIVKQGEVGSFIEMAIKGNAPIEMLERLFTLQKEVKAETAREAFNMAITKFQSSCPKIEKTKTVMNKDGHTVRYKFAPLDEIAESIKSHLSASGLSYSWNVDQDEKGVKANCTVKHVLGHSETSSFRVPVDTEGFMAAPRCGLSPDFSRSAGL